MKLTKRQKQQDGIFFGRGGALVALSSPKGKGLVWGRWGGKDTTQTTKNKAQPVQKEHRAGTMIMMMGILRAADEWIMRHTLSAG